MIERTCKTCNQPRPLKMFGRGRSGRERADVCADCKSKAATPACVDPRRLTVEKCGVCERAVYYCGLCIGYINQTARGNWTPDDEAYPFGFSNEHAAAVELLSIFARNIGGQKKLNAAERAMQVAQSA